MTDSQTKLKSLLRELFQLDNADLDFGIYRIMNAKRTEIERFLDNDLLPQVKKAFEQYQSSDSVGVKAELEKTIQQAKEMGVADPETLPKVKELRTKLAGSVDVAALENQVFSDLYNFFRRYYSEGDFLSLRRYKEGVYAIPYEGEEVKLHWANHDQYYIKSSEYLRDYRFKVGGKIVHFKLTEADAEKDNNKAPEGNERRFILTAHEPVSEEHGELLIRFKYVTDPDKRRQDLLNAEAVATVLKDKAAAKWLPLLGAPAPTQSEPNRIVIEKHLADYTARNNFDYFIHKDVHRFLSRELDFFIKNEVMHLDDVDSALSTKVDQYLSRVRVLRLIAHKIVDFVAQLEDFQKKLWLKKKFVVDTQYCVTLDRIPEKLYPQIAKNDAQRAIWVDLFSIDEIQQTLTSPKYSAPLTVEFLKANKHLVVDTGLYDDAFRDAILSEVQDLSAWVNGTLVQSENSQALRLIQKAMDGCVSTVYIDPPYNTDASPLFYKNGYRNSSWVSLMDDRLRLARELLADDGVLCVTIDDTQQRELAMLVGEIFGNDNLLGTVTIRINPSGRITLRGFAQSHEYAIFAGKTHDAAIGKMRRDEEQAKRYNKSDETGSFEWRNFRREGSSSERTSRPRRFFPIYVSGGKLRVPRMTWDETKESYVDIEPPAKGETAVLPIDSTGGERVWRWGLERITNELGEIEARADKSGKLQLYYKYRPNEEGVLPGTIWADAKYSATEHGTGMLKKMFGGRNVFSFPKSIYAVQDCIEIAGMRNPGAVCVDFFAGSGTTAHATIELNRTDDGQRKYVLVEMGDYFDSATKPRVMKSIYSREWKDGKPVGRDGVSHSFRYLRLESYEDTLANLDLSRSRGQQSLLESNSSVREDYVLRYMLDVESRDSASILKANAFADPTGYLLNIATGTVGETKPTAVDLVETFNWMLGLRVKTTDIIKGVRVVTGTNPRGEKVLVLWRNVREMPSPKLDEFFQKQGYNTKDMEFDVIYVNGDNNLENLKKDEDTWKVRLIEEDFKRLMFDMQDV